MLLQMRLSLAEGTLAESLASMSRSRTNRVSCHLVEQTSLSIMFLICPPDNVSQAVRLGGRMLLYMGLAWALFSLLESTAL